MNECNVYSCLLNRSFVTENPYIDNENNSIKPTPFTLPDGHIVYSVLCTDQIQIGKDANSIPELLFYPTPLDDPSLISLPLMIANQQGIILITEQIE